MQRYRMDGGHVRGLAVATCCHHCMQWADYVGRRWWQEEAGLSQSDFTRALRISGWATGCRPRATAEQEQARQRATGAEEKAHCAHTS